jgi:hypothetical protein
MPDKDILWKQYDMHMSLFKEYLNLALKMNAFYYVATGALISFYFSKAQLPWMKYSLVFPALMSLELAGFFFYGAAKAKVTRQHVMELCVALGFDVAPEYYVLTVFLYASASLMILVAVSLLILICSGPKIPV